MLHKDQWLSTYFKNDVYKYESPFSVKSFDPGFYYAKLQSDNVTEAASLVSQGFNLVETAFLFQQNTPVTQSSDTDIVFRDAGEQDKQAVGLIAETAFTSSRFYKDQSIDKAIAANVKKDWALNFFSDKRGDRMIVAEENNSVVGFLLMIGDTIDLIAVDASHTRKKIAKNMIAHANQKQKKLKAGTQACNHASIALYRACGFSLMSTSFVFHHHVH